MQFHVVQSMAFQSEPRLAHRASQPPPRNKNLRLEELPHEDQAYRSIPLHSESFRA